METIKIKIKNLDNLKDELSDAIKGTYICGYIIRDNNNVSVTVTNKDVGTTVNDVVDAHKRYHMVNEIQYKNPPLDLWLTHKMNWCKRMAYKYTNMYNLESDDTLSDVLYIITRLYNKNVYMNSLNYLETSLKNSLLRKLSKQRHIEISMDAKLDDGTNNTLHDIIGDKNATNVPQSLVNKELIKYIKSLLSPRERQIIACGDIPIPPQLKSKLKKIKKTIKM